MQIQKRQGFNSINSYLKFYFPAILIPSLKKQFRELKLRGRRSKMAELGGSSLSLSGAQPDGTFRRKLGNNELFCKMCHNAGNLNVMAGLTLLTRTAVDEGTDI